MNRIGLSLYPALMVSLWVSYIAAEIGYYHGLIPLVVGLLVTVCLLFILPRSVEKPDHSIWFVILLAITAGWFSWPPGHVMQSQWDPAMYIQSGSVLAREGGITFDLSSFNDLPREIQSLVSFPAWQPVPYSGFILREDGQAVPLFFHLYNCWVAMMYSLGGIDTALAANIPLYVISIILVFILVRKWFGGPWAMVCSLLLAFAPAQLWQSRFPTSELLTQVLLLGGFIFLDRSFDNSIKPKVMNAILAGLSFGLAFMTRVDTILVLGPLIVLMSGFLFALAANIVRWVLFSLLLPVAHTLFHLKLIGSTYFPRPEIIYPFAVVALIVVVVQCGLAWRRREKVPIGFQFTLGWTVLLTGLWLGWVIWAWQIRPRLMLDGNTAHLVEHLLGTWSSSRWYAVVSGRDAWNMILLKKLCGWPILLFSAIGSGLLLFKQNENPARRIWLIISMSVTICLITSLHHERAMMWMTRRFIPVIIPFFVISAIAVCWYIWPTLNKTPGWKKICSIIVAAMLVTGFVRPLQSVWNMREFYGTKFGFEALARVLNRDAIIFSDVIGVGASLRMVYGFEAYELNAPTMERHDQLIEQLIQMPTDRPVLFITPVPVEPIHENRMHLHETIVFSAVVFDQSRMEIPTGRQYLESPFYIYEITRTAYQH